MTKELYEILGVDDDATTADIKKAARKKRVENHPDRGGDQEKFVEVSRALAILSDPVKREKYDKTGNADDATPPPKEASAMGMVDQTITAIVTQFVTDGFEPTKDIRFRDIIAEAKAKLWAEAHQARVAIATGKRHVELMQDVRRRLRRRKGADGPDFLSRGFESKIEQACRQIEAIEEGAEVVELAMKLLADYTFQRDAPAFFNATVGPIGFTT